MPVFSSFWFLWIYCMFLICVCVLVTQLCLTLCDPMDCSLPGSSVHGVLQARILERVVGPFSRGSSRLRDWALVSHVAGRFLTVWATREETSHCSQGMPQTDELVFCPQLIESLQLRVGRMRWFGPAYVGHGEVLPKQHGCHTRQEGSRQQCTLVLTHLFLCCWRVSLFSVIPVL